MPLRYLVILPENDRSVDGVIDRLFQFYNGRVNIRDFSDALMKRFMSRQFTIFKADEPEFLKFKRAGKTIYEMRDGVIYQKPINAFQRLEEILREIGPQKTYKLYLNKYMVCSN